MAPVGVTGHEREDRGDHAEESHDGAEDGGQAGPGGVRGRVAADRHQHGRGEHRHPDRPPRVRAARAEQGAGRREQCHREQHQQHGAQTHLFPSGRLPTVYTIGERAWPRSHATGRCRGTGGPSWWCRHNRTVSIEPDTKDWTWVIEQACPDCGFEPNEVRREQLADLLHENTRGWYTALTRPDVARRPEPGVWSVEYACHVRDVHALFAVRVRLMLEEDDPSSTTGTRTPPRWSSGTPSRTLPASARSWSSVPPRCRGVRRGTTRPGRPAEQRLGVHRRDDRPLPPARRGAPPLGRGPAGRAPGAEGR